MERGFPREEKPRRDGLPLGLTPEEATEFNRPFAVERRQASRIEHPEKFAARPNATQWTFDKKKADYIDAEGRKYRLVSGPEDKYLAFDYIETKHTAQLPWSARGTLTLMSLSGDGSTFSATIPGFDQVRPYDRSGRIYLNKDSRI